MLGRAPSEGTRKRGARLTCLFTYFAKKILLGAPRPLSTDEFASARRKESQALVYVYIYIVPALQLAMVLPTMTTSVAPQVTRARKCIEASRRRQCKCSAGAAAS